MARGEGHDKAVNALAALTSAGAAATGASLVVAAGDVQDPFSGLRAVPLAGAAPLSFLASARAATGKAGVLIPFEFGYSPEPYETAFIDLHAFPEVGEPLKRIAQVESMPLFDGDRGFVEHFKAFAIVLEVSGKRFLFLRRAGPRKELGRNRRIALLFQNGTFDTVHDRIFLFDEDIDLMATDDVAIVLNPAVLQVLFPSFSVVADRIERTLDEIAPFVSNFADLRQAVAGQPQMRGKLMQIAQRPYLSRITLVDLKAHIARKGLDVRIGTREDGSEGLLFDPSLAGRWVILKMLDDDYLDSVLTKEQYEVNSKSRAGSTE